MVLPELFLEKQLLISNLNTDKKKRDSYQIFLFGSCLFEKLAYYIKHTLWYALKCKINIISHAGWCYISTITNLSCLSLFKVIFYYGNLLPLCVSLKTIDSFRSFALPTKRSQTEGQNIIQTIISRYKRFLIYHIRRYIYI